MDRKKSNVELMADDILKKGKSTKRTVLTFLAVLAGPFIAAIIVFSYYIAGYDEIPNYMNWILVTVFIPLIFLSLIIGQYKKLIGAYGETILLLIPTFVWLLPGHSESLRIIATISFIIIMTGVLIYIGSKAIRHIRMRDENKKSTIGQILLRVSFVAATLTSTVVGSIIMVNWGDVSLHLARVHTPTGDISDYTKSAWIIFIAIITIVVALTLVLLGLITNIGRNKRNTFNTENLGFTRAGSSIYNKKKVKKTEFEKTTIINISKKKRKK